jgi:hypothetical protein
MGKLLRVLVVLLLILGIAALVLGLLLFQKRELLKGHVQDMAKNVLELSGHIEAEQADDLTKSDMPKMSSQLTITQLLTYKLDPSVTLVDTNKPATMDAAMRMLIGKAQIELGRLDDTRKALAQKIQELDVATNKIAALEANIVQLEAEKKQLQENVAALEKDVAEKKGKIEELTTSLDEAKTKITDLTEQVAKLKDTILDKDDKIKSLNETIEKLRPKPGTETSGGSLQAGTKGKIVLVNKTWNFVVIAINEAIGTGVELTVQRGDKLIGKVRVSDLNDQYKLAIGDVMLDWKQADVEVGDYVFY